MKKTIILFFTLLSINLAVADTVYVTDTIKFTLRSSENNRSKILKMLTTGDSLTVLNINPDSGYTKVKTVSGIQGYILTRHTLKKPVSSWYLKQANKKLETLQKQYDEIRNQLGSLMGDNSKALSSNSSLSEERDILSKELNDLRQTAANSVQLKHQRDHLQERVVTVERELQQLKRENQTLADSTNQDWFLYGGILSLIGVIFGFILPKLSWRRKTTNWDTF